MMIEFQDALNRAALTSSDTKSTPKHGKEVVEAYEADMLSHCKSLYVIGHLLDIISEIKGE